MFPPFMFSSDFVNVQPKVSNYESNQGWLLYKTNFKFLVLYRCNYSNYASEFNNKYLILMYISKTAAVKLTKYISVIKAFHNASKYLSSENVCNKFVFMYLKVICVKNNTCYLFTVRRVLEFV